MSNRLILLGDEVFGIVHLSIGLSDQLVGRFTILRIDTDADSGRDLNLLLLIKGDRFVDQGRQFFCHQRGRLFCLRAFKDQDELITTDTCNGIASTQALPR